MTSDSVPAAARPQSTASTHTHAHAVICPDPSAHAAQERQAKLQETASAAALLVTRDRKDMVGKPDSKLSSAGAAASLKYAKPQDLPAFPIVGVDASTSASKAALLANANPAEITWWKPEKSDPASKAALLAHNYKMAPLWQPEASAAGSRAALLAHRDAGKSATAEQPLNSTGNSAAGAALRKGTVNTPLPPAEHGTSEERRSKALMAATGAFSGTNRRRSGSTPAAMPRYPDAANSAFNALNAATISHRNSTKPSVQSARIPITSTSSAALEASRVHNLGKNMPREMFGDAPPVSIEVEEKRRSDALRASAISMAQGMYALSEDRRHKEESKRNDGLAAATSVHGRSQSTTEQYIRSQAMQFLHVQDAAQRLANERLAKMKTNDEAAYRDYYGYGKNQGRSRLSVRRPNRRRASSEGRAGRDVDSDDEEQSRRIRSQMSLFNNKVQQIDSRKRAKDREALMAAAEKKVHAQMHSMDEKVFNDTGKMSQSMLDEWDAKARARAAAESEARLEHHGKVHIGGGKFMDQSEIEAIAASRLQPTLDEIDDQAEKRRARDEEIRLDIEEKKRQSQMEKDRDARFKVEEKRIQQITKDEEKRQSRLHKEQEKAHKAEEKQFEKNRKAEEKRVQKEEKRKSRDAPKLEGDRAVSTTPEPITTEAAAAAAIVEDPEATSPVPVAVAVRDSTATEASALRSAADNEPTSPSSPTKGKGIRGLLTKLKRRSKHSSSISSAPGDSSAPSSPTKSSFLGGAALTGAKPTTTTEDSKSQKSTLPKKDPVTPVRGRSPSISSLSSSDAGGAGPSGRAALKPRRDFSDDDESNAGDEARDKVEKLAPPPKFSDASLGTAAIRKSGSPVRETIFKEEF